MGQQGDVICTDVPWSVSHSELLAAQQADETLKGMLEAAQPVGELENRAQGYFIQSNVLMRKWAPQGKDFVGDPVYQVVVPARFRSVVLQSSHFSGHGVSERPMTASCVTFSGPD